MLRRKLSWVIGILFLLVIGYLAFRFYSWWEFRSHLDAFSVTITKEGMPGALKIETILSSDGKLERYETQKGIRTLVGSTTLDSNKVVELRAALMGLSTMRGAYSRPLWDQQRNVANFLDFEILLGNGNARYISLHNVNPLRSQRFLETYNGLVPDAFQIRFRRD